MKPNSNAGLKCSKKKFGEKWKVRKMSEFKKKIAGVGACKHPHGRGKSSCEFTIDKVRYYFCYGYYNDWGDDISPYCEGCPAHIDAADDVLQQLIKEREKNE